METIKNAIGLGTAPQEGREPVSGVSGAGTAGEPYDQGNVDGMSLLPPPRARVASLKSVTDNIIATTLGGKAPQQTGMVDLKPWSN